MSKTRRSKSGIVLIYFLAMLHTSGRISFSAAESFLGLRMEYFDIRLSDGFTYLIWPVAACGWTTNSYQLPFSKKGKGYAIIG